MDTPRPDVAFTFGVRIRAARFRGSLTLADVQERTGISTSTQSRMELGQGAGVALGTWDALATAVGADLFAPPQDERGIYPAALASLMRVGAWSMAAHRIDALWFDRPPRPFAAPRSGQLPAERAVVRLIRTVTDIAEEHERLRALVDAARDEAPPGLAVAGVIVAVRSTDAVRRAARAGCRLSDGRWLRVLQDPRIRMPHWPGWVWLAPRATHLLPWGA